MNSRVRKNSRLFIILIMTMIGCLLMALPVLAGQGNGSGGGKNDPLSLVSSSPVNGQKDFPINGEIKLKFNKNVVNLAVKDNNKTCFVLAASDGNKIPIEVIMPDDQMNPEQNENVSLKPLQELKNGTAYVVKISPQLQAKAGASLDKEVTINFVTEGIASNTIPTKPEEKEKTVWDTIFIAAGVVVIAVLVSFVYRRRKS